MGAQFLYGRLPYLLSQEVDFSASGDNTVVAAVAGKRINIQRVWFVVGSDVTITFKRGSTDLSGAVPMLANGSFVLDLSGEAWFSTDVAEAFIMNTNGAVQVSGMVYFNYGT